MEQVVAHQAANEAIGAADLARTGRRVVSDQREGALAAIPAWCQHEDAIGIVIIEIESVLTEPGARRTVQAVDTGGIDLAFNPRTSCPPGDGTLCPSPSSG